MNWNQIKNRFTPPLNKSFWAVVTKNGYWADSSQQFKTAVHWAAMDCGAGYDLTFEEEINAAEQNGYSIIHSDFLVQLANAGLIK